MWQRQQQQCLWTATGEIVCEGGGRAVEPFVDGFGVSLAMARQQAISVNGDGGGGGTQQQPAAATTAPAAAGAPAPAAQKTNV